MVSLLIGACNFLNIKSSVIMLTVPLITVATWESPWEIWFHYLVLRSEVNQQNFETPLYNSSNHPRIRLLNSLPPIQILNCRLKSLWIFNFELVIQDLNRQYRKFSNISPIHLIMSQNELENEFVSLNWAGNFWMVDIRINAWSTLFLNLEIK